MGTGWGVAVVAWRDRTRGGQAQGRRAWELIENEGHKRQLEGAGCGQNHVVVKALMGGIVMGCPVGWERPSVVVASSCLSPLLLRPGEAERGCEKKQT